MKTLLMSIVTFGLSAAISTAQTSYTVTDLGAVGGTPGQAYVIANDGLVAGASASPQGTMRAVLSYKGQRIDLGTPGLGGPHSTAFGVNELGQTVGQAESTIPNKDAG